MRAGAGAKEEPDSYVEASSYYHPSKRALLKSLHRRKYIFRLVRLSPKAQGAFMAATGEMIRLMNYVDDIAATLRRITANLPLMDEEEKRRLSEYMRKAEPNYIKVLEQLERGAK